MALPSACSLATAPSPIGAGTFNVADLEIGYGNSASTATILGGTTGTLNVNNNGLFGTGATVICRCTVLNLAHTNGCQS